MLFGRCCPQNVPPGIIPVHASHNDFYSPPTLTQSPYLGEGAHGQQGLGCDGVVPQVRGGVQWLDAAHLPLRAAEETARVARPHAHHPPGRGRPDRQDTRVFDTLT